MTSSYTGHLPFTDENTERSVNSEHLQVGTIGMKQVILLDSNGNPVGTLATAAVVGQTKIAVTGTAVQLPSGALSNGVILSAKTGNTASMTIGGVSVTNTIDGTGNGAILPAGASLSAAIDNTNRLYVNGTSGDILSWIGS